MILDTGLIWVSRMFAKLLDRVRFPPVSPRYLERWRTRLMSDAFNPTYEAPRRTEFLVRHIVMDFESKLWWKDNEIMNLKTKIKDLQIELSKAKRRTP